MGIYAGGNFVAVGESGNIIFSPDGITWSVSDSFTLTEHTLNGIAYSTEEQEFVAVGNFGTVLISRDQGQTWILQNNVSINDENLTGIAYGNGYSDANGENNVGKVFVAVSSSGHVFAAKDNAGDFIRFSGAIAPAGNTKGLYGITHASGQFIAVGDGIILASPDGQTWVVKFNSDDDSAGRNFRLNNVTYANGRFVAVGANSNNGGMSAILTSVDTENWTAYDTPQPSGAFAWEDVVWLPLG